MITFLFYFYWVFLEPGKLENHAQILMSDWSGQENLRNTVTFWTRYQAKKTWISGQPTNRARKTRGQIHYGTRYRARKTRVSGYQARKTRVSIEPDVRPGKPEHLWGMRARKTRIPFCYWIGTGPGKFEYQNPHGLRYQARKTWISICDTELGKLVFLDTELGKPAYP